MTTIKIDGPTNGSNQPCRLTINGVEATLRCNVPVEVSDDQLSALQDSDYSFQIIDGDTAAGEADLDPAPADSGGGGDAGGGGQSGGPAAETPAEKAPAAAEDAAS